MIDPIDAQSANNDPNISDHNARRFSFMRKTLTSKPKEIKKNIKYSRLYCLTSTLQKEVIIVIIYTIDKLLAADLGQGDEVQVISIRCKFFNRVSVSCLLLSHICIRFISQFGTILNRCILQLQTGLWFPIHFHVQKRRSRLKKERRETNKTNV